MDYILNRTDESENGLPDSEDKITIEGNKIWLQMAYPEHAVQIYPIEAIKIIMENKDELQSEEHREKVIEELAQILYSNWEAEQATKIKHLPVNRKIA